MRGEFEWKPGHDLKSLAALPRLIPEAERPRPEPPRATPQSYRYAEPVVASTHIKWKPIDRVASRVVSKAPPLSRPPEPAPKKVNPADKFLAIPGQDGNGRIRTKRKLTSDGYVEELMRKEDVIVATTDLREKNAKEAVERTQALLEKAQETYDVIEFLVENIGKPAEEYLVFVKETINRIREQRMALQTETRTLMSALRDVREFFLEDKHEEEVHRLTEFVQLCERLKRLKDSGFLDTVADTMLKLTEK